MSDINKDPIVEGLIDTWTDKNKPVSEQIRERITKAGERFFAADNISDYIEKVKKKNSLLN